MYLPEPFAEERLDVLHGAVEQAGLATLVTVGSAGLVATHLPLLLDRRAGAYGTLYGHLARANPQWRDAEGTQALVIFLGPEAYVSPSWYATKQESGRVVPTWNYLAVHGYGPLHTYADPQRLRAHVERLTARHESRQPAPWQVSDAPEDFLAGMLRGIVGIEIPIERLEGKWKLSQNRPEADRLGTIAGLRARGEAGDAAVAGLMEQRETGSGA